MKVPDTAIYFRDFSDKGEHSCTKTVRLRFFTPVLIKQDGKWVPPTFGPLLRRLRDRINALAYFYCGETISQDFSAFGHMADAASCRHRSIRWIEEGRYSRHRDLKHTLKGFMGSLTFEGELRPFLPFLRMGQYVYVGNRSFWTRMV